MREPTWLLEFKRDLYSQGGEDGIVSRILETLPENDLWCVELGASDGRRFSNTRHLIEDRGYHAVLIEAEAGKFRELRAGYADFERVIPLHRTVGFSEGDGLDRVLTDTPVPEAFDFLSIDVDGIDYHIWQATTRYQPKLVCIEFNPTIPTEVDFVQSADPGVNQGSSLKALVELGNRKGYELAAVTAFNALFVSRRYWTLFEIEDNRPEILRTDTSGVTHIFSGFDGRVFLAGYRKLPWHDLPLSERRMQALPVFLRRYPPNYGRIQEALYRLLKRFRVFGLRVKERGR